jgi:MoaA/NifB/PqqE/SkfB family radical SAM enzyme
MAKLLNRIHIEISNACNLQCSFCPEVMRKKQFMSVPVFKEVLGKVAPFAQEICLHLMGEPLMHRQLAQILDVAFGVGTPINLTTNGVLLTEKKEQLLLHPIIRQVNFSLQSYLDNFPERDPYEYLEKIVSFSKRALENRPDLYINFRFWNFDPMQNSSPQNGKVFEFLERKLNVVIPRQVDFKFRKGRHLRDRMYAHFDSRFVWPSLQGKYYGTQGTCKALQVHAGVLVDGTMVPCCLDKEGDIPLGNLLQKNFEEIYKNVRTQKMLKGFQCGKLTEGLCQHCNYIQRFEGQAKALLGKNKGG